MVGHESEDHMLENTIRISLRTAKLAQQALERGVFQINGSGTAWRVLAAEANTIVCERM